MGNPHDIVERLKHLETDEKPMPLAELRDTAREARECIESLLADFEAMERHYETQQRDDDERRYG